MATIAVDSYEDGKRVLRHIFYGTSEKEARHFLNSHRKSDPFFDATMRDGTYKGIELEHKIPKHGGSR